MEDLKKCPVCTGENFIHLFQCKDHFLSLEIFSINKCKSCGLIFTNPRPDENKLYKYYESKNYISHSDKAESLIDKIYNLVRNHTLKQKYKIINKYNSIINGNRSTILDIGCGTGEFLKIFKNKNWNVFGIEPNDSARKIAQEKNIINVADNSAINNFSDNQFDVITMWHVLEHVYDLNFQINQIKRILNKNGTLIVAVPNVESPDAQLYKQYWAAYDVPRHLYHFNKDTIGKLFQNHDFEIIKIYPMKFDAFYVSLLSEKYKSGKANNFNAFLNGLKSNFRASHSINYSSLIFVIKNKIAI